MTTRLTLVPDTDLEDQISATLATSPKVDLALRLLRGGASLHRVIAIGRYRNSWTPAEARWIKKHYIDDAPLEGEWRPSVYTPRPTRGVTRPVATLTPRQAGVLDGLCRDLDAADIADEHGLTRNTVQYHIRGIVRLLGAVTPGHAATLARTGQVRLLIVDNRSGRPMAARSKSSSSSQTYTHPIAVSRLREGLCPECGGRENDHGGWGGPACTLTDNGVAERVHAQRELDQDRVAAS